MPRREPIRSGLTLYDTLSASQRPFEAGPTVKMYVCGVTPYDTAHLGHGFTYVAFDVLIRYLRYLGHDVRYIQNVTDIDDPLFEKAAELGIGHADLARRQTESYLEQMAMLNVLPADEYPHASREIPGMLDLITTLIENGHAYAVDGFVYFDVSTDADYGELSKYDHETMLALARERGGDPDDPRKRNPLDFVLWRPSRPGEPIEDSPWGPGLPGWHLECSAMASRYLGPPIDVHGGGNDLIYPHHESEIAQSEGAGEKPFARFWMHTGMIFLGGEKMSKSLGNMVFVGDLVDRFCADAVRLYLSGCHYRNEMHYDEAVLAENARLADRLTRAAAAGDGHSLDLDAYLARFEERMNDDLDTPGAIRVLADLASEIEAGAGPDAAALLRDLGSVLGLQLDRRGGRLP